MQILYLDESGCTGVLASPTSPVQPVFVLAGIALSHESIQQITPAFLWLKRRFFPTLSSSTHYLDSVLPEIKGADLRRSVSRGNRDARRHAVGFLEALLTLLEDHKARLLGRVLVKGIGRPINSTNLYTLSVQAICDAFQHLLRGRGETGLVIADHRNEHQNAKVSHSIFTRKFSSRGDWYPNLLEMPVYGHSQNQVGLQIADLICSALLFPMATYSYCHGSVNNVHVQEGFALIRDRFGDRLKSLQYRYTGPDGRRTLGGIMIRDLLGNKGGAHLFGNPIPASRLPLAAPTATKPSPAPAG